MNVSIALATYNGEKYLRDQLASVAAQTLRPCELVVGDDGSSDRTLEIVESFAAEAPFPVSARRSERRLGARENFLETARRCRGDWIAFCDQDDIWLPHKLESQARAVESDSDIIFSAHRATIIDEDSRPVGNLDEPPIRTRKVYPPLGHRLWRTPFGFSEVFRSFLVRDFPSEGRPLSTHDRWVFWLANVLGRSVYLPDRLVLYRRHRTNESQLADGIDFAAQLGDAAAVALYDGACSQADEFARYLEARTPHLTGSARERVERGVRVHRRLADHLRSRAAIWDSRRPFAARLGVWARLAASGGYGSAVIGGTGWKGGFKDLARIFWPHSA